MPLEKLGGDRLGKALALGVEKTARVEQGIKALRNEARQAVKRLS